jgi:methionyl aminopeptidase
MCGQTTRPRTLFGSLQVRYVRFFHEPSSPRFDRSRLSFGETVSIQSPEELLRLRAAGLIARQMLQSMKMAVRPGVTTGELDEVGARVMRRHRARSAPAAVYQFPGTSCISVNEEAVHGISGRRVLRKGDLVKLDVTVEKDGFMADAAITVAVGTVSDEDSRLIACVEQAFNDALEFAREGCRICELGRAIEGRVLREGFSVIRDLCGHGIGRTIHEPPTIPNYYDPQANQPLTEGLVITIEPIIAAGRGKVIVTDDGWTVRTADSKKSAHFEHTLVITKEEPILLTAA